MNTFRRFGDLLRPHRRRFLAALVLAALTCLLNLPVPLLVRSFVDRAVRGPDRAVLPLYAVGLLAVFALQAAAAAAATLVMGRVGLAVVRDLRHRLYARLQRLSLSWYDRTPPGAVISRLVDDVSAVGALATTATLTVLTDLGGAVVVAGWLLAVSPRLFLAAALFVPAFALLFRRFTRRLRRGTEEVRRRLDAVFARLKEKVDGVLVVKAHAREEAEAEQFAAELDAAHDRRVAVGRLGAAFAALTAAASGVGAAVVFAVAAFEALHGRLTPGEAVSASALAALLFGPVTRLADLAATFEQARTGMARLGDILDQTDGVREPDDPLPLGRVQGRVDFDGVGFGYQPGLWAVRDVSLHVEPGMKVALVGPTGCGKTTLMNLLLRFYDPRAGDIRLDGLPLRRLSTTELRRRIGVVPQETVLFRASLADNIRYGNPDAADEQVEAAARAALVHDFAVRLPDGYRTLVGEGGHRLSQGERQRVAIARALCKDPALVVLDEATSALDPAGEALVQRALANLLRGRTAFVIAHRLATVLDADRIVVLEAGRVVQVGDHAELLAEDGLYRRLCAGQWADIGPVPADEVVRRRGRVLPAAG